jgi:pimeloyl-ACP methyl ester carboxylesterase
MTMHSHEVAELNMELGHGQVLVRRGGSGQPLVVLHRDTGPTGWSEFHSLLAEHFTVFAPSLPGYPGSAVPRWLRTVTQLATLTGQVMDRLEVGCCPLVGLGFGGWVAAELAAMSSHRIESMVLQAPMGIRPTGGFILDQFLYSAQDYMEQGFASREAFVDVFGANPDPARLEDWEVSREMTVRIAWKPYMYNLALPHLLANIRVATLVAWGTDDQIVPLSCRDQYVQAIPLAHSIMLVGAGHQADLEQPRVLAAEIAGFVSSSPTRAAAVYA